MKEKAKSAATHKVSIRNKAVPTLGIAALGLMLVGGASAAVLTNFATVDDTSTVSQSIEVGDTSGGTIEGEFTDTDPFSIATAGDSSSSTYYIQVNQDQSVDVDVNTTFEDTGSNGLTNTDGFRVIYTLNDPSSTSQSFTHEGNQSETVTLDSTGEWTLEATLETDLDVDASDYNDLLTTITVGDIQFTP